MWPVPEMGPLVMLTVVPVLAELVVVGMGVAVQVLVQHQVVIFGVAAVAVAAVL